MSKVESPVQVPQEEEVPTRTPCFQPPGCTSLRASVSPLQAQGGGTGLGGHPDLPRLRARAGRAGQVLGSAERHPSVLVSLTRSLPGWGPPHVGTRCCHGLSREQPTLGCRSPPGASHPSAGAGRRDQRWPNRRLGLVSKHGGRTLGLDGDARRPTEGQGSQVSMWLVLPLRSCLHSSASLWDHGTVARL